MARDWKWKRVASNGRWTGNLDLARSHLLLATSRPAVLLLGAPFTLPTELLTRFPELAAANFRRGGLPLRIGGWLLGRTTVSGITLWRTIWLAPSVRLDPELLLHELRHVHQFEADRAFPLRYLWRSIRHGYTENPYEADARAYAARRLAGAPPIA